MKYSCKTLIPVLLGGDLNAYSVAMSFARYNGAVSEVFTREKLALTETSAFINIHIIKNLENPNFAVPALIDFAKKHSDKCLLLIPCADWYMEMLEYARDALEGHFYFFIPDFETWRVVSDKSSFLRIMDKYGIPHPKTALFDSNLGAFEKKCSKLAPPFVVKPADSSEYWKYPFEGMKKVYFSDSLAEVRRIAQKIYSSGYDGKILVQEYIGTATEEAHSSVLTTFSDKDGRVIRAVLGDVLLEEKGDSSRGNYSAIMTRELDDISHKIIDMLNKIKYVGIANFDILRYDLSDYCLELNPRQGRSFDYIRGAGVSLASFILSQIRGDLSEPCLEYPDSLWRAVFKKTLAKYCEDDLYKKVMKFEKNGKVFTPYDFFGDRAIKRKLYVAAHLYREHKRYNKYAGDRGICY